MGLLREQFGVNKEQRAVGRVQRAWCANLARRKERLAAEAVAHTEALEWRLQEAQVWESSRIY